MDCGLVKALTNQTFKRACTFPGVIVRQVLFWQHFHRYLFVDALQIVPMENYLYKTGNSIIYFVMSDSQTEYYQADGFGIVVNVSNLALWVESINHYGSN